MENTVLTPRQLRERMAVRGITISELAREADLSQTTLSAILRGKDYCGDVRRQRIEHAIETLNLDVAPEPEVPPVVFRIRQL